MKTAVLNIKIDPKVRKEAQKVADELGFTLSAIINASLKNLAREKTVTFQSWSRLLVSGNLLSLSTLIVLAESPLDPFVTLKA